MYLRNEFVANLIKQAVAHGVKQGLEYSVAIANNPENVNNPNTIVDAVTSIVLLNLNEIIDLNLYKETDEPSEPKVS